MNKWLMLPMICLTATAVPAQNLVEKADRDEVAEVAAGDPFMRAMIAHAKKTLDHFLQTYQAPEPDQSEFSVKVKITDQGQVEYFWVNGFVISGDEHFIGILDNEPRVVKNVTYRQKISFTKADIVDWAYYDGDQMQGNFTACALLRQEPEAQRIKFQELYGLDCNLRIGQ